MMSARWTWAAIGYMTGFAWCIGLMVYQIGGLITGEVAFNFWTVVAFVVAAGMLYLIFRPTPDYSHEPVKGLKKTQKNAA